jgi:glucose 1-dehydrogenase
MKLAGQTALVTGAGRGIGKGCALELARAGADIVLNDRPDSPDVEIAQPTKSARWVEQCHVVTADVFSRSGCEQLVSAALQARNERLISSSAIRRSVVEARFLDYSPELFENTIRGTLISGFHLSQLVARHMVERKAGGKIVFISSVQAEECPWRCVPHTAPPRPG